MNPPSPFFPAMDIPEIYRPFLSLGASVQSNALALMAAHEISGPVSDGVIFAGMSWKP